MTTTLRTTTTTAAAAAACLFLLSALLLGKKCDFEIILSASAFGIAPSVTSSIPTLRASSSSSPSSFHHHHHVRTLALSNSNNIIESTSSSSSSSLTTTTNPATSSNNSIIIKEDFPSLSFHSKSLPNSSSSSSIINGSISSDNTPPNLQAILNSIASLKSGSDIRGTFVNHKCSGGTIANVYHLLKQQKQKSSGSADAALLTPFAAHCFGVAFARWTASELNLHHDDDDASTITVCVGRDPRVHGERIADSFARGAESVVIIDDTRKIQVKVVYTGIATTPSMFEFVRADKCDAAVMITASHLPEEKNGLKFFSKQGGLTKHNINELIVLAQEEARHVYDLGILPPSSGNAGVLCSERVDYMPYYKETLRQSLLREVSSSSLSSSSASSSSPLLQPSDNSKPLSNINIVVNPGNGAGCFFVDVLRDLGAIVDGSIHLTPDGTFPPSFGVPNPEKKSMVEETIRACEACHADIGIMFDTDADRAGFILPRSSTSIISSDDGSSSSSTKSEHYEPLNKNRLIALLSVIFSVASPGCTIVTDSTTSEGLHAFLEGKLNLRHFRYLRGYANVIGKARELTESGVANAEVAIETSGHCAMKENGYVDDGTYTAVKIVGLLARTRAQSLLSFSSLESSGADSTTATLLDMISDLDEMPYVEEFRVRVNDGSSKTTTSIFDQLSQSLIEKCNTGGNTDWSLDEDNLEGFRARILSSSGGFFMIRQSLHDPVISVQVEARSKEEAREKVLGPMLELFSKYHDALDYNSMEVE